jgi:hypothetical protein
MNPYEIATEAVRNVRRAGFQVVEDVMAPRPWSDNYFKPKGVLLHHTASTSITSLANEKSDVHVIKNVIWGPPGAQFYVGRTGRIYVICKGGANHAGTGGGLVAQGIPKDEGNYFLWGIENQSRGLQQDWTKDEWMACHALAGELLRAMDQPVTQVWRHKDYDDDSGKIDTQYPLAKHREAIRNYLHGQEDEVTGEDFDKIRQIVRDEVREQIKPLAEDITKQLLGSDVFPKRDDIDKTVRQALREAAHEDGETS